MQFNFYKMQSTGNDFVVTDYIEINSNVFNPDIITKICDRNFGIGSDGFIAIEKLKDPAFKLHYYNIDGLRGEMCANGCRAAILFALDKEWIDAGEKFNFVADDGSHYGLIENADQISVSLNVNNPIRVCDITPYDLPDWIKKGYFTNTGVPHLILICDSNVLDKDIHDLGTFLRFHDDFGSEGTNVNFMEVVNNTDIIVRTFERGIDGETLSCGTGITASALVAKFLSNTDAAVINISTLGGKLKVLFDKDVVLCGASEIVFKGSIKV